MNGEHVAGETVLDVERPGERVAAGRPALAARIRAARVDRLGVNGVARPHVCEWPRRGGHHAMKFRRMHRETRRRRGGPGAIAHEPQTYDAVLDLHYAAVVLLTVS